MARTRGFEGSVLRAVPIRGRLCSPKAGARLGGRSDSRSAGRGHGLSARGRRSPAAHGRHDHAGAWPADLSPNPRAASLERCLREGGSFARTRTWQRSLGLRAVCQGARSASGFDDSRDSQREAARTTRRGAGSFSRVRVRHRTRRLHIRRRAVRADVDVDERDRGSISNGRRLQ